ncbi:alpha-L-arabinofuranosidase [Saccharothrix sp. NRRL B-16348]|uniref:cellulose binding domain-containing protein n=1 Tax=Saccharothrix sp. NRRL B-16348 TaxID=1415542 RepID=UPI0006ADB045|nr:cellulose binding domain-containing protein [Saccharothrix sp. NRRL B-16348]KOX13352.1 alpha-L-arabinofuranosidase [Saccharothrix sp. NRRL B-16348]
MRPRLVVLPALAALVAAQVVLTAGSPAQADSTATVTVNTRAGLEVVDEAATGVNHAIWDTNLGSDAVADLLKDAGVKAMRYPGGSYSDIYHWADHTAPGGYVAPNTDFDTFMGGVRRAGGQAIVTANYGTGTAEEAAAWVRYANVEKNYGVKYWEIGNENYGNGHYGSGWEADHHPSKSPTYYATLVRDYATAMKAVDPTIKIGAVLTTPGEWPDGIAAAGDSGSWNEIVLEIAGPVVDFGIIHWYPGGDTAAQVLAKTDRVKDQIALVREQSRRLAGKDLGIALTEVNTSYGRNTQPGALFAADAYATMIGQGVFNVDWWNVHNGIGQVREIAGHPDYDDYGLLSSGTCNADGTVCEPALNTPFAPYHAISMVSRFARPGDQLVTAASTDPLVRGHAARRPDGGLAVMLINQDPDAAKTVDLRFAGYSAAADATVLTFANGDTGITTTTGSSSTATLPPYSITTLVLRPHGSVTGPAAPARPALDAVTDRTAALSWPTPPAGVKYEVHRVDGANTEQWGETTGATFTAANLTPGTEYTVNLVARDNAGRVSWSSPPLTFTTGTPATSTCAVTYRESANWGNGFVADLEIANTGTTPVAGWTLTYTWPTTWQQVSSGWNATWSQTGHQVSVAGTATLAPGSSTTAGFVGSYQGPNVHPVKYFLNGKLCTTR